MTLYGSDLLKQIYAAYLERYQKALERGYDAEGENGTTGSITSCCAAFSG